MNSIHPSAIIDAKAQIGQNVSIGPYTVIEADVIIGDDVTIGAHCYLAQYTELGNRVKVFHGAVLGTVPQDLKFKDEKTKLVVGEGTVIREFCMFNRGTAESGQTIIGKNCLLMAYMHVAHDCAIGNNVIIGNATQLAGHVKIDDQAIISGLVPIHQFVHIGEHTMIGGGLRIPRDVCPYSLIGGYPLKVAGVNIVGLGRRGFTQTAIRQIKNAFKFLFFSDLNTSQAVEKIKENIEPTPEINKILEFVEKSERGMIK